MTRRALAAAALLAALAPLQAAAQEPATVDPVYDVERIGPVGRINRPGVQPCTGVLVAPRKALTTASCVHFPNTAEPIPAPRLFFLAGYLRGRYRARRRALSVDIHPGYSRDAPAGVTQYGVDFAMITLSRPVTAVPSLAFTPGVIVEERGAVASYEGVRPERLTIRAPCVFRRARSGLIAAACFGGAASPGGALLTNRPGGLSLAGLVVAPLAPVIGSDSGVSAAARPPSDWFETVLDGSD